MEYFFVCFSKVGWETFKIFSLSVCRYCKVINASKLVGNTSYTASGENDPLG